MRVPTTSDQVEPFVQVEAEWRRDGIGLWEDDEELCPMLLPTLRQGELPNAHPVAVLLVEVDAAALSEARRYHHDLALDAETPIDRAKRRYRLASHHRPFDTASDP